MKKVIVMIDADDRINRIDVDVKINKIDVDDRINRIDVDVKIDKIDADDRINRIDVDVKISKIDATNIITVDVTKQDLFIDIMEGIEDVEDVRRLENTRIRDYAVGLSLSWGFYNCSLYGVESYILPKNEYNRGLGVV